MITMIPRSKLEPHPDNPRKDLGDLSELSASIAKQGLLQNLTVVPSPDDPGKYRIVIGHRRFAASAKAGLDELPCSIDEKMTYPEQIATMLLENMQRSDLTIYEQAQGFQMMMDLGMTTEEISAKTGFSDTTVRRRVKLAALNKEGFKTACDNGATLMDFAELSKVENEEERNKILADAQNAGDLRSKISIALRRQNRLKVIAELEPKLAKFAKPMDASKRYSSKFQQVCSWDYDHALERFKTPDDTNSTGYYYYFSSWDITLYKDAEKREMTDAEREAKEREKKRKALARDSVEYGKSAASFRQMFVEKFKPTKAQLQLLQESVVRLALEQTNGYNSDMMAYHSWEEKEFRYLLNMPKEDDRSKEESIWEECKRRGIPEGRALLAWMLCGGIYEDKLTNNYCSEYDGTHRKNKNLDQIYALLTSVGYYMTNLERALQDGTHKCFKREDK